MRIVVVGTSGSGKTVFAGESLRMAFLSRESVLLWSLSTFARNQRKFKRLREDPEFAHLAWTEITTPSGADLVIRSFARADA